MILLKITIILCILQVLVYIVYQFCYHQLSMVEKVTKDYPKHIYILSWLWALLFVGFIGCLIATIILW